MILNLCEVKASEGRREEKRRQYVALAIAVTAIATVIIGYLTLLTARLERTVDRLEERVEIMQRWEVTPADVLSAVKELNNNNQERKQ